jgi:hypothetical protein
LGDFNLKHLLSHLLTDTISVDDQIRGSLAFMILLELFQGSLNCWLHVAHHDFLTFFLDEAIALILCHLSIYTCSKADNGLSALMTHIDANKHGSPLG